KSNFRSRRRVVADRQQTVATLLPPDNKGGAMVGTEDSLFCHVERDARGHTIRHDANNWAFLRRRKQQAASSPYQKDKPSAACSKGTEVGHVINFERSHDFGRKIASSRGYIRLGNIIMQNSALRITMLKDKARRMLCAL